MKNNTRRSRRRQSGFSIIEALIAGLVLSFGSLALVGTQVALSRNADVAKQRTEATRHAQDKMEELRSFGSMVAVTGIPSFETMVASVTPDTLTDINTTYTRRWTVAGAATSMDRRVTVEVAWTDRNGAAQLVSLSSVVARADHSRVGLLMANSIGDLDNTHRSRDNNVPFPAVNIGSGRSRYQWPGNVTDWYVFNNVTGTIEYSCATSPTDGATQALNAIGCTAITGYVLAGYVSTSSTGLPPTGNGNGNGNGGGNNAATTIDAALALGGSTWSISSCSITTPGNISTTTAPQCFVLDVVASGGTINPSCPYLVSGNNTTTSEIARLRFYKCYAALIIVANASLGWDGRLQFLSAPTSPQRICRYNHNLVNSTSGAYVNVAQSLSNENYFAQISGNCATGQAPHQF